jgi:hypothetical protein
MMYDPKPLTREELDDLEALAGRDRRESIGPETLRRIVAQCRRCLELEALLEQVDKDLLQGHYTSAAIEVRETVKAAFDKLEKTNG